METANNLLIGNYTVKTSYNILKELLSSSKTYADINLSVLRKSLIEQQREYSTESPNMKKRKLVQELKTGEKIAMVKYNLVLESYKIQKARLLTEKKRPNNYHKK